MLYLFFDQERIVRVEDAAFVLNYTTTTVELVPPEGGPAQTVLFGSRCELLRTSEAKACVLAAALEVDTSVLDAFLLEKYQVADAPTP